MPVDGWRRGERGGWKASGQGGESRLLAPAKRTRLRPHPDPHRRSTAPCSGRSAEYISHHLRRCDAHHGYTGIGIGHAVGQTGHVWLHRYKSRLKRLLGKHAYRCGSDVEGHWERLHGGREGTRCDGHGGHGWRLLSGWWW